MAISLSIQYRDADKEGCYIPIITYQSFNEYWKPIATRSEPEWVLLIQSAGIPLERHFDDLPTILDELQVLKDTLQSSYDPALSEVIRLDRSNHSRIECYS